MTYREAMSRFGSDKPDIRFDMQLKDIKTLVTGAGFKVFDTVAENGGEIKALLVKGCAGYSRKQISDLETIARSYGAKGLAWMKKSADGLASPILKFIGEDRSEAVFEALEGGEGDLILIVADTFEITCTSLGALRSHLGQALGLIPEKMFSFVWVTDFPMFEWDEEEKRYTAVHHPFTAPKEDQIHLLEENPAKIQAQAYDIALNGFEIGGGSIRTHDMAVQKKVFETIGISEEEAEAKFGFLLSALKLGAPPHGGIAFGFDRIAMIFSRAESIREVIAFPKTTSASCLMTGSPSDIDEKQLKELGLKVME